MTIPSRPAPAPPGSRAQNAAAGANASLEQLRLQLQQQHLHQQQTGNGLQKLTIKLPPPPKGPLQANGVHKKTQSNNNFYDLEQANNSSITRKFPQARYTPATNWNDSPFGAGELGNGNGNGNGNYRKVPPPRPPPPKVQVNGRKMPSVPPQSHSSSGVGLITNIFQRKKATASSTAAASKAATQNRVYGLSSGHATTPATATATAAAAAAAAAASSSNSNNYGSSNYDWNAAWNTAPTIAPASTTHFSSGSSALAAAADAQLISFDSPPSSPTFTQKSNSDCVSVDSFSSDSNFSSPNNGSVSQPESGFEDDYHARSRPATNSPLDPWETLDNYSVDAGVYGAGIGTAPVRQLQQQTATMRLADNPLCNGKSLLPPAQSLPMPTIIKPKISQKPKAPKPPPFLRTPPGYAGSAATPPSPPMPNCAPPPPPPANVGISMLDVISGKVDPLALSNGCMGYMTEKEIPYAIALYDFDGAEEGDLNFRENEKIYLLEQPTAEWYRGRTRAGCEGLLPANYVDVKVPLDGAGGDHAQASQQLATARCLYNFPGEVEGDLALQENEMVTILYRINEDWLFGEVAGRQGQFPANFLDFVPDNLPTI